MYNKCSVHTKKQFFNVGVGLLLQAGLPTVTVVWLHTLFFWNMLPHHQVFCSQESKGIYHLHISQLETLEEKGTTFLHNVRNILPSDRASYPIQESL
jgi:hypothetical protein